MAKRKISPKDTFKRGGFATRMRPLVMPEGLRRARKSAPDLVPADTGQVIVRAGSAIEKSCEPPSKGKNKGRLRPCHSELIFVGDRQALERGVEPGTYLQFCSKPKARGLLAPVTGYKDATIKANKYCKCLATTSGDRASCARDVGATGQRARAPRKKRRRR